MNEQENRTIGRPGASGLLRLALAASVSMAALAVEAQSASAQEEDAQARLSPVIVTAQKREETENTVPMSITAASAAQLQSAGITQPRDLVKITPGFHYADSYVGSPIFTLRGVGFSDISLGGRPTVSVYADEVPIPFAITTRGAGLDPERVEVLKGPQGTLFGQNATGGAVNYIAAKPTDELAAGADVTLGNFGTLNADGFLSGAVSDTLNARIAVRHESMDDWQESYTTGAGNGSVDFTQARVLFDWEPTDSLDVNLAINGWIDRSDVMAGQLIAITPAVPPIVGFVPGLATYPLAPADAQAADFNPEDDYARDNSFFQASGRADYLLTEDLQLTSILSYSEFSQDQLQDIDGTSLDNLNQQTDGKIESLFAEFRLAREFERGNLVVGINYAGDDVVEVGNLNQAESTLALVFTPFLTTFRDESEQEVETSAVFASGSFDVSDTVRLSGGLRYTSMTNKFSGCTSDTGDGVAAAAFGALLGTAIAPGGCVTADATFSPGRVSDELEEDNWSWRTNIDWRPSEAMMLYANIGRGFKAGSFPTLAATVSSQLLPATQESITSYEAGFKATLLASSLQLNGAVFHSDYEDKQILGKVVDPFLGPLLKLVNVPESQINGAELQLVWVPADGLRLSAGGSFIDSEIQGGFTNFDPGGALRNFDGESFPNTPELQLVGDVSYTRPISAGANLVLGANASYASSTNSQLGELSRLAVDEYTLVDLRAGLESSDGSWRIMAWGRNVGDAYYWTTGNANLDTTVRFSGMPRTYGITLTVRH